MARKVINEGLPGQEIFGHTPEAGLPKNFHYAGSSSNVTELIDTVPYRS